MKTNECSVYVSNFHFDLNKRFSDPDELISVPDVDFEYVLVRRPPASICFGSALEREILPVTGRAVSPFMRLHITEVFPDVSPTLYDLKIKTALYPITNKVTSKKGFSGCAFNAPRFETESNFITPSCNKYNLRSFPKSVKRSCYPFDQNTKRMTFKTNNYPSVGTYNVEKKDWRIQFRHSFNGKTTMIPAVEEKCVPFNMDNCEICRLTPLGDYWHKNYLNFLCLQCYSDEYIEHLKYTTKELKKFQLMRDCSFMHNHENTTAGVRIIPQRIVNKKHKIETYLNQYFKDFIPQPLAFTSIRSSDATNFKDSYLYFE